MISLEDQNENCGLDILNFYGKDNTKNNKDFIEITIKNLESQLKEKDQTIEEVQ